MRRRTMKATVTVYAAVNYDITVRFDAFEGDTPERMRESAVNTFRFIGMDVKPYEAIIFEEAN